MAVFLSEEWTKEATSASNASGDVGKAVAGVELTIQQTVSDKDVTYWTRMRDGTVEIALGGSPDADVHMTLEYATAAEMDRGETSAQAAFMDGRLKITGNMGKLLHNQDAVNAILAVLASLQTQY